LTAAIGTTDDAAADVEPACGDSAVGDRDQLGGDMSTRHFYVALSFTLAALLLEAGGTLLHWFVLHDVSPDIVARDNAMLWMLQRDALLALVGGAVFGVTLALLERPAAPVRYGRAALLGVVFAIVVEAWNWVVPGALFTPETRRDNLIAWLWFVLAAVVAALVLRRWNQGARTHG
jgi:hypothetical protein